MKKQKKNYLAYTIIALGIALMIAGTLNGEISVVLNKAINICLECIGIG